MAADDIGSQQFNVPEAFCVMNVNQTTKQREKNVCFIQIKKHSFFLDSCT